MLVMPKFWARWHRFAGAYLAPGKTRSQGLGSIEPMVVRHVRMSR
jgi:hypothetical protein